MRDHIPSKTAYRAALYGMGFHQIDDLNAAEINARYFANRKDGLKVRGNLGHLIGASV